MLLKARTMNRRAYMATTATALALPFPGVAAEPAPVFRQRGYYLCFMRMRTCGLAAWREILDAVSEDGGNTVILWMGGAFRSQKFPISSSRCSDS